MSALFTFWFHSDIVDLQNRLAAGVTATQQTVTACTKLDAATVSAWNAFSSAALAFTKEDAAWLNTSTQADMGQSYERQLVAWQQLLSGRGCSSAGPMYDPNPPAPPLTDWLKYGAIIAGFVGTAYVVGKVAEFLPRPAPRKQLAKGSR